MAGRRLSSPNFSVVFSQDTGNAGYAVVVPKKTARLSVTRHRIKRRVAAALCALEVPPSLIVFPKNTVNTIDFQALKQELADLLSKIPK